MTTGEKYTKAETLISNGMSMTKALKNTGMNVSTFYRLRKLNTKTDAINADITDTTTDETPEELNFEWMPKDKGKVSDQVRLTGMIFTADIPMTKKMHMVAALWT